MTQKKTLVLALSMFIVVLFIALAPDLLKRAANKAAHPVTMNTWVEQTVESGDIDKVSLTELDRQSSEVYMDLKPNQIQSKAQANSINTTNMSALQKTTDSKADSENSHEVTHIEFLKVHKAAGSTGQSIILRFGLKRNLSFVIPTPTHYISVRKIFFSDIWPPLPKKPKARVRGDENVMCNRKYDILSHHMVFNHKKVAQLLYNDTVYIAIVRDPFDVFISAAFYYKYAFKPSYAYLDKLSNETFITDLIRKPRQYEATTMAESMSYNSMAYDFGLGLTSVRRAGEISEDEFIEFLNNTGDIFHLVMVVEKFDESLVLLKRYLNWSLQDILYTKINTFLLHNRRDVFEKFGLTADDMDVFRQRNKYDYRLYNFFKDRLDEQISKERLFTEEVEQFKRIQRDVQNFCSGVEAEEPKTKGHVRDNDDSSEEKKNKSKKEDKVDLKYMKLVKLVNLITITKNVSTSQEKELYEMLNLVKNNSFKGKTKDLLTLLPLLFRDKDNPGSSETKLLVPQSDWNKDFYVTPRDCDLLTKDIMSLYEVVKQNHLKILIETKFGSNFSLIEAVRYVLTFY